jgi:hypothetical protein
MNLAYMELAVDVEFSSYVEFFDSASQFDSEYNMPSITKPVNSRSNILEDIGSNGVHPTTAGYLQLADIIYRGFEF